MYTKILILNILPFLYLVTLVFTTPKRVKFDTSKSDVDLVIKKAPEYPNLKNKNSSSANHKNSEVKSDNKIKEFGTTNRKRLEKSYNFLDVQEAKI